MRSRVFAASMLAAMVSCVTAFADEDFNQVETCGAMLLVSHDFGGKDIGVKPMADFLIEKAGELRGRRYTSREISELKDKVTLYVLEKVNAGEDLTEWSKQTGVGCAVLAWRKGYRVQPSTAAKSKRGSDRNEALAEQLGKIPGVSRW